MIDNQRIRHGAHCQALSGVAAFAFAVRIVPVGASAYNGNRARDGLARDPSFALGEQARRRMLSTARRVSAGWPAPAALRSAKDQERDHKAWDARRG